MVVNKNQIFKLAGVVLTCAVIAACSSSDPENKTVGNSGTKSSGSADFTKFVSIGDSLTAGYADGALYLLGQQNSFPNILSQQFAEVGGGTFTQPLVNDNLGGLVVGGMPILDSNGVDCCETRLALNTETQRPERLVGTVITDITSPVTGPFNNVGVPAAKSFHLGANGYGDLGNLPLGKANPYFVRFSSMVGASVITDAAGQQPSFYTLWIGSNDVIWYGFAGGDNATATDQTGSGVNPANYKTGDITDPAVFKGVYSQLVGAMKAANPAVQGVLINVPDVTTIPYFTTVPYNPVPLDQATADQLNAAYAPYNAGIAQALAANPNELARRTITFVAGQNAVVIDTSADPGDLTDLSAAGLPSWRQATAGDLIPLEQGPVIGTLKDPADPNSAWGVGVPLEDKHVLIPSEIQAMKAAVDGYNAAIKAAADADPNLILFNVNKLFTELNANGEIDFGTGSVNADFATGGFFSLDGIHPTARGYAILSNEIIDVINTGFGANVYKVDPATYPAVLLK